MGLASFNILASRWHLLTEIILLAVLLVIALIRPLKTRANGVPEQLEQSFVALSERPWLQAFAVGGLAVFLRAALLPVLGAPVAYFPDDFSILFQGQTFGLGRVAMPTHPLHEFFETYYVNQVPSYASMYFPGRGAPLGLGILLFGSPWLGVWLTMVALCMTVPWMLRAWVSKPLALAGGILVAVKFAVLSGWINTFHGGGLTALGGVLVLGAYPRLMREPKWLDGSALGLGVFLLMVTRPFEGMLFSAPFGVALAVLIFRQLSNREIMAVARTALPALITIGAGLFILLSTNAASTGSGLKDPYSLHRSTHAIAPPFLFQERTIPSPGLPPNMRRWYEAEAEFHLRRGSLSGVVDKSVSTIRKVLEFYVGPLLAIPFLMGLVARRRQTVLLSSGFLLLLGVLLNTWEWSQYWAPGFGLFTILITDGLGRLRKWRLNTRESGLFLSRALPGGVALMTIIPSAALYAGVPKPEPEAFFRSCCAVHTTTPRSAVEKQLLASPGRDLVIVRHRPNEPAYLTLVANEPNIDQSEIVWAHDLGSANQWLLDYYPDRNVWRVYGAADTSAILERAARQGRQ